MPRYGRSLATVPDFVLAEEHLLVRAQQLLAAVRHMHGVGFVHMDIIAHFRGFRASSGEASPTAVFIDKVPVLAGAPGCAAPGCWWVVSEEEHSVLCPSGALVMDTGGVKSVAARVQFGTQW